MGERVDIRRPIPMMTMASFGLVGCNDDQLPPAALLNGDGQLTSAEIDNAAAAICAATMACERYHDSRVECEAYYREEFEYMMDYAERVPGYENCGEAYAQLMLCYATTGTCTTYEYDGYSYSYLTSDHCDGEYAAYVVACDVF